MVKGSCNLDFLRLAWIIDEAADRVVYSNDRWSIDEGRSTCCLQNYGWQQTDKIGQIAIFLVRLLQDLSEKLDIGHKISSKRFHGQNNSEFSNWFIYTSRRERCHGQNLSHVASDFIFQTSCGVWWLYHSTAREHLLHQQFFTNVLFPKVSFVNINRRSFWFLYGLYSVINKSKRRNSEMSYFFLSPSKKISSPFLWIMRQAKRFLVATLSHAFIGAKSRQMHSYFQTARTACTLISIFTIHVRKSFQNSVDTW